MSSKKLVVFDVDGTFLDSIGFFERVLDIYSQEQGLPTPNYEAIRHGYGHPHDHDFGWGVDREEQVRHLYAAFELMDTHAMSEHRHMRPQLFNGVFETFEHLKDTGHTLAIVTSKAEAPLLHALDNHDLHRFFSAHRTSTDIERRGEKEKPAPDMLHSVMRELKFSPEQTVMVGDTTMDIRMGRAALVASTVGVTWGAHPKAHLVDAGAHHIIDTVFNDVAHTVKKIFI